MNRLLGFLTLTENGIAGRVGAFLAKCALAAALAISINPAIAQEGDGPYDKIEEDWELIIGQPREDDTSPQIINVISPLDHLNAEHAVLELNHSTQPDYSDGGIQFQRWFGNFERIYRTPHTSLRLSTPNEKITYTMYMAIANETLTFGVKNGKSQTWGDFGGNTEQWKSSIRSRFESFSSYDPAVSVKFSRVGYAANRVRSFQLNEIRYYRDGEVVRKDVSTRIVSETVEEPVVEPAAE